MRIRPSRRATRTAAALTASGALLAVAGCGAADMTQQASPYANA
ncbi:glycine/betaine ABC transporter substrate-binding protein, partial [Streptomyces albidoflavus]